MTSTAIAPLPTADRQLARLPASAMPAPIDKQALTAYLAALEDPQALELQQRLAAAYDAACKSLIGPNDVQKEGGREFKKKSAWRKLQRYFAISTDVVDITKEFLGEEFMATVTVRATAPWGQTSMAAGSCATDEETGRRTITMADAVGTAETRATNRAVSNLIAMGEVSAEEIGERKARTRPELTLEDAETLEFPWKSHKKYAGKSLKEVSTRMLLAIGKWAKDKIDAGDASETVADLYRACVLITEQRPDLEAAIEEQRKSIEKDEKEQAAAGGKTDADGAAAASAPEGEQRPDPTTGGSSPATTPAGSPPKPATTTSAPSSSTASSATSSAPAAPPATTSEPSVAELQRAADTAATAAADPAIAKQTLALLTGTLFNLLGDDRYAKPTRDKVRARLAGDKADLSAPVLQAAIEEIEAAKLPF